MSSASCAENVSVELIENFVAADREYTDGGMERFRDRVGISHKQFEAAHPNPGEAVLKITNSNPNKMMKVACAAFSVIIKPNWVLYLPLSVACKTDTTLNELEITEVTTFSIEESANPKVLMVTNPFSRIMGVGLRRPPYKNMWVEPYSCTVISLETFGKSATYEDIAPYFIRADGTAMLCGEADPVPLPEAEPRVEISGKTVRFINPTEQPIWVMTTIVKEGIYSITEIDPGMMVTKSFRVNVSQDNFSIQLPDNSGSAAASGAGSEE